MEQEYWLNVAKKKGLQKKIEILSEHQKEENTSMPSVKYIIVNVFF